MRPGDMVTYCQDLAFAHDKPGIILEVRNTSSFFCLASVLWADGSLVEIYTHFLNLVQTSPKME